ELVYHIMENNLSNLGMNGKACLLRAICEMFQMPLDQRYGIIGEVLELMLSASKAPHADIRLKEYVEAERIGKTTGECHQYIDHCSHSLFISDIYQSPHTRDNDMTATIHNRRRGELL
ncbi:hypothetical protein SK128_002626, partial [Halocaridina rubra]